MQRSSRAPETSTDHHAPSSHLRCAVARRRRDLQGSRRRGRISAQSRQGQGQACRAIDGFDGLAIRSATKVTAKILEQRASLKVIGRAGIGVDNVDIPAATARGIIVMNTPFGNSITTAEHAITLMLALARQIPEADASTRAGKWEKNKFLGVEIFGKTLGVIGCGNIGSIVADRAHRHEDEGDRLRSVSVRRARGRSRRRKGRARGVVAPRRFHHAAHAAHRQDPQHHQCRDARADQEGRAADQLRARRTGRRGGACARRSNPATSPAPRSTCSARSRRPQSPLFALPNVVCTPHLGASTMEAQENVALQVAEQMSDYLLRGAITNAVNFPSISAEEAPKLKPFVALAEKLGSFAGQLTETGIEQRADVLRGRRGADEHQGADLGGGRRPASPDAARRQRRLGADRRQGPRHRRRGDAPRGRGRLRKPDHGHGDVTDRQTRSVSGTVYADGRPRIVNIKGIRMDAEFGPSMLYVTNQDKPGFVGTFRDAAGGAGINIATFHLGRESRRRQRHRAGRDRRRRCRPRCSPRCRGSCRNVQQVKPLRF